MNVLVLSNNSFVSLFHIVRCNFFLYNFFILIFEFLVNYVNFIIVFGSIFI